MPSSNPPVVMIVDDDANIARVMAFALRTAGYDVHVAGSGTEALKLAAAIRPVAVVTDIIMDDGDGIETIMGLRRLDPTVKIVAVSGGGRIGVQDFLDLAGHLGADATLGKPFRPSVVVAEVSRLLAGEDGVQAA